MVEEGWGSGTPLGEGIFKTNAKGRAWDGGMEKRQSLEYAFHDLYHV